jgi:hypothetical protein
MTEAGWPLLADETVTERDIDVVGEIAEADEIAEHELEYRREVDDCCGGRDWRCGHYGHRGVK